MKKMIVAVVVLAAIGIGAYYSTNEKKAEVVRVG